ncbi:MAG: hypothetical protein PHY93_05500 [Bacteriovorax sp.]|nr:hypothetical protein [Bacteriovorax sp.]
MKLLFFISTLSYSLSSYACPQLQGRYNKCFSEIRKINGEYIVDQHQENNYEVYNVEYSDDETGENRKDLIKTNNQKDSRKESLPRMGVTVTVEARSNCVGDAVVSGADVFFLGAKVGSFVSKIFVEGKNLKSNVDGSYLGKDVHKRIVCELK